MRRFVLTLLASLALVGGAQAQDGLITVKSTQSVDATAARLVQVLEQKGLTVFASIDHAAGARKVGQSLHPATVVLFGNPKMGTPLMKCAPSVGIDLPLKALIWQDAEGQVWIGYNDPQYLARRHGTGECGGVIGKMGKALGGLTKAAAAPAG